MFGHRRIKYKAIKSTCESIVNMYGVDASIEDLYNKIIKLFEQINDKCVILKLLDEETEITLYRNGKYSIGKSSLYFISNVNTNMY